MPKLKDWPWRHWARTRPTEPALHLAHQTLTWQALNQQITRLAYGFQLQGIHAGDHVALRGKNSPELLLAYLALLQQGARVLPLNPALPHSLLASLLPSLNITFSWDLAQQPLLEEIQAVRSDIATRGADSVWEPGWGETLTLTSGSTGQPKAALHSIEAHLSSAHGVLARLPFTPKDCWLLSLPLYHVSGQGIVWRWLYRGAQLKLDATCPLEQAIVGCSHASLVPTQLARLLAGSLKSFALREVLLGGDTIPVTLTEQAKARGIRCWCGYGMTEMASTVFAKQADGSPGVGTLLPGREMQLVDGEVWVRGHSLAKGYWRDGVLHPCTDTQGWLHTRDRGEWRGGELYLIGRMDNLFFSGGEGIQPEEIEKVLLNHPAVQQAMVVPLSDREFGHRPVAVVTVTEGFDLTQLSMWLADKVMRYQQPDHYLILPEELKEGGIKISRQRVKEWVGEQLLRRQTL